MPRPALRGKKLAPAPPRTPRSTDAPRLSVVASFDDLMRKVHVLMDDSAEKELKRFVLRVKEERRRWRAAEVDRVRLDGLLKDKERELNVKEYKIKQARNMVEEERKARNEAEAQRDLLAAQIDSLKSILSSGQTIDNETLERVRSIDTSKANVRRLSPSKSSTNKFRLTAVDESKESILDVSDFSFDNSNDNMLDENYAEKAGANKSKRRSSNRFEKAEKRRKSRSFGNQLDVNQCLATTRIAMDDDGNAHAEAVVEGGNLRNLKKNARKSRESRGNELEEPLQVKRVITWEDKMPPPPLTPSAPPATAVRRHVSNAGSVPNRPHHWAQKKPFSTEKCSVCNKRLGVMQLRLKCEDCAVTCHVECKNDVPLPCVAASSRTPTNKPFGNNLVDYTPDEPPMIPAILIHCIRELETRGLTEVGLYRVPGSEAAVQELLEKFHRGKRGTVPSLQEYEVPVIASTAKKFLRSLKEPLIPRSQLPSFQDAVTAGIDPEDRETALVQAVAELPTPNRDTLAFLVLHLQRVANSPEVCMPAESLATVFGPTLVSNSAPDPATIHKEFPVQAIIVRHLVLLSSDYWNKFVQFDQENILPPQPKRFNYERTPERRPRLPPSPSKTGPIARRTRSKLFPPHEVEQQQQQRYFESPQIHN